MSVFHLRVGELLEEVSEYDHFGVGGALQMEGDVPVSEDAEVVFAVFVCPQDEFFAVVALVWTRMTEFLEPASAGPFVAEGVTEGGRKQPEEELRNGMMEEGAQAHETPYALLHISGEQVHVAGRNKSVPVCETHAPALKNDRPGTRMDCDSRIAGEVTKSPDVVVAREVTDGYPLVGELSERAQERLVLPFAAREMPVAVSVLPVVPLEEVLVPEVEHVAEEDYLFGVLRHLIKQTDKPLLVLLRVGDYARTEMGVTQKIYHRAVC